ncbi:MAG: ribosome recycling factor [Bacteroidales bacterium]|nr:ribosome recycling factor [Bacteroidales bacterium]
MTEESKMILDEANEGMEKAIEHLENAFKKIRAGKANPQMLSGIKADFYGSLTPIEQMANISTPDPRQITVQPWDKSTLGAIEKAIMNANLGFNPQNDGELVRITVPPLTEERRLDLVKAAKNESELAKISIRNIRRASKEMVKSFKDEGISEDEIKDLEDEIQNLTNKYSAKTDALCAEKEQEIITI